MKNKQKRKIPLNLEKKLAELNELKDQHVEILSKILKADEGNLFGVDLVVMAVIQRSTSLINGFASLVEQKNVLCAVPLIRLQIDSVLRLYSCWLVDGPHSIANLMLEGKPFNSKKDKEGNKLTDKYLREKVSEHYKWIDNVYKKTSGFIHLSYAHFMSTVMNFSSETGELESFIGLNGTDREWKWSEIYESVDAFIEATTSLLHLCYSWHETKSIEGDKRSRFGPKFKF